LSFFSFDLRLSISDVLSATFFPILDSASWSEFNSPSSFPIVKAFEARLLLIWSKISLERESWPFFTSHPASEPAFDVEQGAMLFALNGTGAAMKYGCAELYENG